MVIEKATYSITEAAELLGISRNLAYNLAKRGELPGVIRLGRRFVVSRLVIQQVLENKLAEGRNINDQDTGAD